jgi:heat shock protein HtpX
MLNIYEQISANKQRSFFIVSGFVAFVVFAAYAIGYAFDIQGALPLALTFSLLSSGASYFWGDKIVLSLNRAIPASRKEFFDFYTVTENLAMVAKIPTPKIYVIPDNSMNAFAAGRDPEHAVVCATTGLLQKLNRTELEGVVAHELSHVRNYDIRLMTIVSVLVGTLSILIDMASRSFFYRHNDDDDRRGSGPLVIVGLVLVIFAPIIAQLIQLAISRRREFFADASAVMLTKQPGGLISALKKLGEDRSTQHFASTATASLYISNPFKGEKIASLFSTHPPIGDRIKALEGML